MKVMLFAVKSNNTFMPQIKGAAVGDLPELLLDVAQATTEQQLYRC